AQTTGSVATGFETSDPTGRSFAPADTTKPPEGGFAMTRIIRSETGHVLDRTLQLVVRAVRASALRRHGVDTADGVLEQAVQAASRVRAAFPGGGIAGLGRIEQPAAMTCGTELAIDLFTATGSAASGSHGTGTRRRAFFALNTDFTNRLETL